MTSPSRATSEFEQSASVAAAAVASWVAAQSRLAPIIGEDGFRVLFARSLHRARLHHPWLAREAVPGDWPYAMLQASLESRTPLEAREGSRALRESFIGLLNALIGAELAQRLLGSAQ